MILNLRGVREAGFIFAVPTYLFVGTLLATIVGGIFRVVLSGGHEYDPSLFLDLARPCESSFQDTALPTVDSRLG